MSEKRFAKVLKLQILKPAGSTTWKELAQLLRDARYRTFRLANLAVSENYLAFHLFRTGRAAEFKRATIGQLTLQRTFVVHPGSQRGSWDGVMWSFSSSSRRVFVWLRRACALRACQ